MTPDDSMLPERGSLVGECVRVIKARIGAGEWPEVLPGERNMAETLNVGRDTIRLALAELTAAGVIESGRSGRLRRIITRNQPARTVPRGNRRFGMLSPVRLEELPQMMLAELAQIRSLLAQQGAVLDLHSPTWYAAAKPERRVRTLLLTEARDGWILYRVPKPVQAAFQATGAPCVIRGYPHDGINLPYLDTDWMAVGRHAMGELWRMGHRRICMVTPQDGMRGNLAAWQGAQSFGENDVVLGQIWADGTRNGLAAALAALKDDGTRPTAFVTLRPEHTVTVLSWLASRGGWVPGDFSIIALATEPILEHFVPAITTYRINPQTFARRMVRHLEWLADGRTGAKGSSLLMPAFVRGASVGRLDAGI